MTLSEVTQKVFSCLNHSRSVWKSVTFDCFHTKLLPCWAVLVADTPSLSVPVIILCCCCHCNGKLVCRNCYGGQQTPLLYWSMEGKSRLGNGENKRKAVAFHTIHDTSSFFFFIVSILVCVMLLLFHIASYCIKLLLSKCIEHSDFRLILLNVVMPCATKFGMHVVSCICYLFFCFRVTKAYLWHCHPVTIDSSFQCSLCEDLRSNFHCLCFEYVGNAEMPLVL